MHYIFANVWTEEKTKGKTVRHLALWGPDPAALCDRDWYSSFFPSFCPTQSISEFQNQKCFEHTTSWAESTFPGCACCWNVQHCSNYHVEGRVCETVISPKVKDILLALINIEVTLCTLLSHCCQSVGPMGYGLIHASLIDSIILILPHYFGYCAQPWGQQGNAQGKDPDSPAGDHSGTYSGTPGCPLGHDG